ncbi:hypothetical protein [Streptomyces rhizosphaericola]|uniref:Uncharacterized protein n=1 Tax=Streptomyces rhizosphaericola TaxID=2564098 RepID=A0ABY2PMG3_9ACTN|nr:hypothetical protein [Streptomyces rhizosphaericola]TGZ12087.1 hypothetical protein E5Z02_01005 [Streptomyces rhizosphaericola]
MSSAYPPGWPEEYTHEALVREVVEQLLSSGGDLTRSIKNLVLDTVTGEGLEKIAVALGADPAADSINASSQTLYWSTQTFKFDPTLITFAPDAVQITPKGIEIFGVNVTPGWEAKFEGLVDRLTPWNIQTSDLTSGDGRETGEKLKNTNRRVNGLEQRVGAVRRAVGRHESAIRWLLHHQRSTASASRGEVAARRATAESQRQRRVLGGPTRAAQDAARLRRLESALRAVEDRSRALERAL